MKLLLISCFSLISICASAQQNDFFLLKHSGRTVKSFFQGSFIHLTAKDGETYSGYIKKIAHDSLWIESREILKGYTAYGGVIRDTMTFEARRLAVQDIASIAKDSHRLEQAAPTILLKLGAMGYAGLHLINAWILHQNISARKLIIAAGVYISGVLINVLHRENYYIGKRFSVQYVSLSSK
jgi:hypothetical protein